MRVISGTLKGRKLVSFRGRQIRPTADRVREAIFNILDLPWEEGEVLDLFAGTGGLGIEALSRGAARAVFIEQNPHALDVLEKNLSMLGLSGRCEILRTGFREGVATLAKKRRIFAVVFLDPPYGVGLADSALHLLGRSAILRAGGVVVAEHHFREQLSNRYAMLFLSDRRKYGETAVSFFTAQPVEEG